MLPTRILLAVSFGSLCLLSLTSHAGDLDALVEKMRKATSDDSSSGAYKAREELVNEAQKIGAPAIPALLSLLHDEHKSVRNLAGEALRDIDGLTEDQLDTLIEARASGVNNLGPAIARIGTPKAADYLAGQFFKEREAGSDSDYGMQKLGKNAVPRLLQFYQTEEGWDDKLEGAADSTFAALAAEAADAIEPLRKLALDEGASEAMRIRAISALGSIGLTATAATPDLQKLQRGENGRLSQAANKAILKMGGPEAADILTQRLEQATKDPFAQTLLMRDISELRTNGRRAGPILRKYLGSGDWDVRIAATRALGYIGDTDATEDLIKQLHCEDDWRVVLSATEALGRVGAKQALPEIEKISRDYWYPPVREAAITSMVSIRTGEYPASKYHPGNFALEFFEYWNVGHDMDMLGNEEIQRITLPSVKAAEAIPKAVIAAGRKNDIKGLSCGLALEHGYLAGSDLGEWGGEIVFFDSKYKPTIILSENTQAIYRTSNQIYALTGLAHMGMNHGIVYQLRRDENGKWTAQPWRALPGEPRSSRLLKNGSLFVNCVGGIVVVSPEGEIKSLTRKEALGESASSR